jgi:hypothetical protein
MQLQEDPTVFLEEFGVDGTLAGQPVRGIFSAAGELPLGQDGPAVTQPNFLLPDTYLPASTFEAALVIPQGNFTVSQADPDGTGWTLLWLTEA